MTIFIGPEKGQSVELDYSQEGSQRIVVGLQWNPAQPQWIKNKDRPEILQSAPNDNVVKGSIKSLYYYLFDSYRSIANLSYICSGEKAHDLPGRDTNYKNYDLDLYCFILDQNGKFLDFVGPESHNVLDDSEKIYHSGEDFSGNSGPDEFHT